MMRAGGGMGIGGGRGFGGSMRSLIQDRSVVGSKVPKGTVRRILRCLAPYKGKLTIFFLLTIVDSAIGVAVPLIYRAIIDTGIGHRDTRLIVVLALVIGGLAVVDAGLSLGEQLCSSQVGQGLIYDLRTRVYAHVQRMSLAFFTRTQTGALVSRLNNDVLGAQQATTDILSSVIGNLLSVVMVLTTMLILSWQITLVALALLPAFAIPARYMGRRLGAITREGYVLAADMNSTMAERFNVAGALLVKLFGRPGRGRGALLRSGGAGARHRCPPVDLRQGVLHLAHRHGVARHRPRLRLGRVDGGPRDPRARHARRDDRLSQPPLRTAHPALERQRRRDDSARLVRPRLRGA